MKPYLKAIAEKLPRTQDRRVKYTNIDRDDVLNRIKTGESRRAIARDTGISRRMISFWEHPERLAVCKKQFKARGGSYDWYHTKGKGEAWAKRMRDIRKRHITLYGKKYGVKSRSIKEPLQDLLNK